MKAGVRAAFLTIAITLIAVMTGFAQSARLSADIPFDFNVGEVKMSSGKYTVKALSPTMVMVKSADSERSVVSIYNMATTPQDLKGSQLVFTQYGNQYFLSAVDWATGLSLELPITKVEIQTARNTGTRQRVQVSSR
jgi:hypothetical protein